MKKTLKVIKIGSHIIDNEDLLKDFIEYFSQIQERKILVHGGGDAASKLSDKMDISVNKIDGRRITDKDTLDVVTMTYAGKINKSIVSALQGFSCNAIGLTGADANSILAKKRPANQIDYGFVGDVTSVNVEFIELLLSAHINPVFCSITHDANGQLLNTNADTIASVIAQAFSEKYNVSLCYLSELKGVLRDINDKNSVIEAIDLESFEKLKQEKVITDGMLPKIETALKSIAMGVKEIRITNEAVFAAENVGTLIK